MKKIEILSFEDARRYVQSLKIKTIKEWNEWRNSGEKPDNIPSNPYDVYKDEWISWGDFLGNPNPKIEYLSFEEARAKVQTFNIPCIKKWWEWCKSEKPDNIPSHPEIVYKDKGWINWYDFLGNPKPNNKYLSFEDVQRYVQSLEIKIKNKKEWNDWYKSGKKPDNIPFTPYQVYKDKWISWSDFLNIPKIEYLSFEDARTKVQTFNIENHKKWLEWYKSEKPDNIPKCPYLVYKDKWISWSDFLGNTNISTIKRKYLSFKKARIKVQTTYNIKDCIAWREWCKSGKKPDEIPCCPEKVYKDSGWIDWYDFLNIPKIEYLSYEKTQEYVQSLEIKIKNIKEWNDWCNSDERPDNIPKCPDRVYKDKWRGWSDFLGYLGNGNIWNKNTLIAYLEQIKDYLHVCNIPQLLTIIESNGLINYITKEKIKRIQETKPDSNERRLVIEDITKELTIKSELEIETFEISELNIDEVEENIDAVDDTNHTDIRIKELKALDTTIITASLDTERINFLINNQINNLWYDVLNHNLDIQLITDLKFITDIPTIIRNKFITEYNLVNKFVLPKGWTYDNKPLLMQKLISYRLAEYRRYGNWSGVGAGKTIGAILAGRYVGAKNTLIITFNSTIGEEDKRGWTKEIRDSFKDSNIYTKINKHIKFKDGYNYLILNYETFQQKGSANYVISLLEKNKFDYIILDEVQCIKQRGVDESKRREVIFGLIGKVRELNPDYYLLAMSATPVINNLTEAKSLVELIEFKQLDDIDTWANISNCIELYRRLSSCGIRHKNIEHNILKDNKHTLLHINADNLYDEAKLVRSDDFLGKDKLILKAKLDAIKPFLNTSKGKPIIYIYYVDWIEEYVYNYLTKLGYKVGVYTGSTSKMSRESTISEFINGEYDILLGSKPMSAGVDGLQFVSDRIFILSLPWTGAEMEQLIGRINRMGSIFGEVDIIIPIVTISGGGETFNWDLHKYNTITYKNTIANAVVDGIILDKLMPSREKFLMDANNNLPEWIERLKSGDIKTVERKDLEYKLLTPEDINRINSELSEFNRMGKTTLSSTMHKKFKDDSESWHRYHRLRNISMADWDEIPYKEIAKNITYSDDKVIDFGCGDNMFKLEIPNNIVTSVDHIAIDDSVIACDMGDLSMHVGDETHDVAVFSLSLWGTNYIDYIKEAYRILRRKGIIYIAEPSKHYETIAEQDELKKLLNENGFKVLGNVDCRKKFIYITGIKL